TRHTPRDLFREITPGAPASSGLFAEVVFDRPLDHAYTYSVPVHLRPLLAVGKRVQVPFGRGDKAAVGYCVGLSETAPTRPVKGLLRVLDEEALLDPNLMRLTRWMADYYLCGWGQVLNAVVPAGAKDSAGTRNMIFVEAVPEPELTKPTPRLTAKQEAALQKLRAAGRALELRHLTRLAQCGAAPVDALIAKGLARRTLMRVDRSGEESEETAVSEQPIT